MKSTAEMLARARVAQYVEECLDVLAVMNEQLQLKDFRRQQSERITNAALAIYFGALKDARISRGVIGRIHG